MKLRPKSNGFLQKIYFVKDYGTIAREKKHDN